MPDTYIFHIDACDLHRGNFPMDKDQIKYLESSDFVHVHPKA